MTELEIERLSTEIKHVLQEQPDVLAAYLFGSTSEGRDGPLSDVDVAVLLCLGLSQVQLWHREDALGAILSRRLPTYTVDLVTLNLAPLRFRFEVISKGQLLYSTDDNERADFESYTMRRYWDFEKHLVEYQTALIAGAKEEFNEAQRVQYRDTLDKVAAVHHRVKEAAGT